MTLRILHLEDDRHDAELIAATLRADGLACNVMRVETKQAYIVGLEHDVDLILADYAVPGFDGLTAQALARERRPHVPFVFVSGTMGEEVAVERLKEGATDYVLKHRLTRLPSAVRRALREAEERRERRRAEQEVLNLNAELEQRVVERTAELEAANAALEHARREAEGANRAKSEFLSRMSHDLRTPLNIILGFAQLLETDRQTPEQAEAVRQILKGGRYLLELINEVLDIARIEAGHLSLSLEPISVAEAVRQALDLVRPLAAERRIDLDGGSIGRCAHHVLADRQRVAQILLNLLSNAVKYNRSGGRVAVTWEAAGGSTLRIKITDTGPGIRPEKLALLFRPFERLGAEKTEVEGTGLGLTISKAFADAMGGRLGVESDVDRGSTFWIELPLVEAGVPIAPAAVGRSLSSGADMPVTGRVLYIEDNQLNIRLMRRLLAHRPGVTLIAAPSGEAGIEVARRERPDLVLLDLHLPDLPGEDVLGRLRAEPETRDVPVAVLSADATRARRKTLLAAGALAYLTKPLDVGQVLDLIDATLNRAATFAAAQAAATAEVGRTHEC